MRSQSLGAHVVVFQAIRVDVGQDRFLAEVVPDQIGDVAVHRFVVGDAVAHRIGDGDFSGARRVQQTSHAEGRVGAELHRVEKLVVETPVDDVDASLAGRRAHANHVVPAHEVATLDEFDAHLPRQEAVLEVGGVVHAGREHDHGRVVDAARRRGA